MSYDEYLAILGHTPKDKLKRVHIAAHDPRFDGDATLYLHPETGKPLCLAWYLWDGIDDEGYLREEYLKMGYDISELTELSGGNGHYSLAGK